jgi:hypothetical protein
MSYPRLLLTIFAFATLLAGQPAKDWQTDFPVDKKTLGVKGSNPYFILTPGYQLVYKQGSTVDTLTVLNEIVTIDGVETRVVEDREMKGSQLVELTRDYYAIDSATNDVYYFGEDVDIYKGGKIVSHAGSWRSGVNGAKFGLMLPARPQVGQRFYQELAPKIAMDRAEIVSITTTVSTPAGKFEKCVHIAETNPLEKGKTDHKWFAPGVGMVKDAGMVLVKYGPK